MKDRKSRALLASTQHAKITAITNNYTFKEKSPGHLIRTSKFLIHTPIIVQERIIFCRICDKNDPTPFMVTDKLWAEAGFSTGMVCIECFYKKLNRKPLVEDFIDAHCNELIIFTLKNEL